MTAQVGQIELDLSEPAPAWCGETAEVVAGGGSLVSDKRVKPEAARGYRSAEDRLSGLDLMLRRNGLPMIAFGAQRYFVGKGKLKSWLRIAMSRKVGDFVGAAEFMDVERVKVYEKFGIKEGVHEQGKTKDG